MASASDRRRTMQVPKRAPPAVRPRVSVAVSGGDGGDAAHWDGTLPTASSATTDEEQSAMDRQFTLLPLVQSNHGAISSLCVWQNAVFIGTVTGTLMRYDIDIFEDDVPSNSSSNNLSGGSSSRPIVHPASARSASTMPSSALRQAPSAAPARFAVTRAAQSATLDVRRHHGRKSSSASAPIVSLVACPPVGVLCALAEGVLCLYDLRTLAFQGRVSPPNGGSIDRFALFPAPRNSDDSFGLEAPARGFFQRNGQGQSPSKGQSQSQQQHRQQQHRQRHRGGGFSMLSLCICAGKRMHILARSMDMDGMGAHDSSLSASASGVGLAASEAAHWTSQHELALPEAAQALEWIDAVHVLVGFGRKKEYAVLNTVTGSSVDLCALDGSAGGETLLHPLGAGRTLLNVGRKSLLHCSGASTAAAGTAHTLASSASSSFSSGKGAGSAMGTSIGMGFGATSAVAAAVSEEDDGAGAGEDRGGVEEEEEGEEEDPPAHLLSDAMLYHRPPLGLGSLRGHALVLDASHVHVYLKPPRGMQAWRMVQNVAIVSAAAMWSDGGSLALLAKGVQIYFLQPVHAADKQRDALLMWSVRSKYLAPNPAAPAGLLWTRAEAEAAVAAHVAHVYSGGAHPFAVMVAGFVRGFARRLRGMVAAEMAQQEGEKAAAAAAASSSVAAASAAASSIAAPASPPAARSARLSRPRASARIAPVVLPLQSREELVHSIREFSDTVEMAMRVMWADCCGTTRASKEALAAAQAAAKDGAHARRASVLFASSGAVSSSGGGGGGSGASGADSSASNGSSSASSGDSAAAALPGEVPQSFLPLCLSLFHDALYRGLQPYLPPVYAALTREADLRFVAAAARHREALATMASFGSSLLRKSPWIRAKFGVLGAEATNGAGAAATSAAAGTAAVAAAPTGAGAAARGSDALPLPLAALPRSKTYSGFGRSSSFSVNFLSSYRGGADDAPAAAAAAAAAATPASAADVGAQDATQHLSVNVSAGSQRPSAPASPQPLLRKSASFHPLSPAPLRLPPAAPQSAGAEHEASSPSEEGSARPPNSLLLQAFERTKLLPQRAPSPSSPCSPCSPSDAAADSAGTACAQQLPPAALHPGTASRAAAVAPPSALVLSTLLQDAYSPSIALLRMLPLLYSPGSKLRLLAKVHRQLLADSQKVYDPTYSPPVPPAPAGSAAAGASSPSGSGTGTVGKQFTMSADDLVPILCFALIHSGLSSPHAEAELLGEHMPPDQALGAEGYALTTLQVALAQVERGDQPRRRRRRRRSSQLEGGGEGSEESEGEGEEEGEEGQRGRAPSSAANLHSDELLSSLTHYASYFPCTASPPGTEGPGPHRGGRAPGASAAGAAAGAEEEEHGASDGMIHTHSSFTTGAHAHAVREGEEERVVVSPLLALNDDYFSADRPPLSGSPSFSNNAAPASTSASAAGSASVSASASSAAVTPAASPSRARPSSYAAAAAAASVSAGNSPSPAMRATTGPQRISRHFGRAPSLSGLGGIAGGMSFGSSACSASSSPSLSRGLLLFGEAGAADGVACSPALGLGLGAGMGLGALGRPSLSRSESLSMLSSSSAVLASSPLAQAGIGSALLAQSHIAQAASAASRRNNEDPFAFAPSLSSSLACSPAPVAEEDSDASLAEWAGQPQGVLAVELRPMPQGYMPSGNSGGVGVGVGSGGGGSDAAAASASACAVPSSAASCNAAAATTNRISMLSPSSQLLLSSAQAIRSAQSVPATSNAAAASLGSK